MVIHYQDLYQHHCQKQHQVPLPMQTQMQVLSFIIHQHTPIRDIMLLRILMDGERILIRTDIMERILGLISIIKTNVEKL